MAIPEPSEWKAAYVHVQRLADKDVLEVLQKSYRDINRMLKLLEKKDTISARVRAEQLRMIQREMLRQQAIIFRKLDDIIRARRLEAAARASDLGSAIDDALLSGTGSAEEARALRRSLLASSQQTVEVAVARMTLSAIPLAQRIYRDQVWMGGRVQKMINSALARGLSAREFAAEARAWFNPNVPGGTRYAAYRLARTEINNAFHATSILQADEKPWIEEMLWHLSRSHPKADICDLYAKGGHDGDGIYRVRDVPRKPHPHCFCYVTPVSPDEDAFLDGLVSGKFDSYLKKKNTPAPQSPKVSAPRKDPKTTLPKVPPKPAAAPPVSPLAPKPAAPGPDRLKRIYGDGLKIVDPGDVAEAHLKDLSKIPDRLHSTVSKNFDFARTQRAPNPGIFIGNRPMTQLSPEAARHSGVRPRGYPEGKSFDKVPGAYDPVNRQLLIGSGGYGHGATSLANHEFGHALDAAVRGTQARADFGAAARVLQGSRELRLNPYFSKLGNPEGWESEMFAEGFAAWSLGSAGTSEAHAMLRVASALGNFSWDSTLGASARLAAALNQNTIDALRAMVRSFEAMGT